MIRALTTAALPATALALLLGCGAGSSPGDATMGRPAGAGSTGEDRAQPEPPASTGSPAPGDSVPGAPATGARIVGSGYAFNAPSGWHDITRQLRRNGQEIDTGAGEDRREATTVRENVNVAVSTGSSMTLDAYERGAPDRLSFMVADLETYDRVQIDGMEAAHVGGVAHTGEASFVLEQFVVVRGDTMYTVSFAVDVDRSRADRENLIDSVLASWEWPG